MSGEPCGLSTPRVAYQRTHTVFIGANTRAGWMQHALRSCAPQSTPNQLYRSFNEHRESFSPGILSFLEVFNSARSSQRQGFCHEQGVC